MPLQYLYSPALLTQETKYNHNTTDKKVHGLLSLVYQPVLEKYLKKLLHISDHIPYKANI